jgi:hypothetical protein
VIGRDKTGRVTGPAFAPRPAPTMGRKERYKSGDARSCERSTEWFCEKGHKWDVGGGRWEVGGPRHLITAASSDLRFLPHPTSHLRFRAADERVSGTEHAVRQKRLPRIQPTMSDNEASTVPRPQDGDLVLVPHRSNTSRPLNTGPTCCPPATGKRYLERGSTLIPQTIRGGRAPTVRRRSRLQCCNV